MEAKQSGRVLAQDGRAEGIAVAGDRAFDVGDDQYLGQNDALVLGGLTKRA